ncbi:MAG: ABC transporter substrate-binding protein, partial [Planctomycetota bacterium]
HTQKPSVEPITECVALDDLTVKYVQAEPLATSRWNLLFPIIPKHIFEKHRAEQPDLKTGPYYNQQQRMPVGNGPYKIVEWKENDRIVVERWDDYFGEKPAFKRIIFRIIPDNNVSLLSFEKQDVDTVRLTSQQFAEETNDKEFSKVGFKAWAPEWTFSYIGYNMDGSNPFFNDVLVRKAMTHATNIQLMIEKITYNLYMQSTGNYHPDSWMYNPDVRLLEYDLDKAAALLDEAGWEVSDEDGWRYKTIDGQPVKFDFTMLVPQGSTAGEKVAAIMQADLKKIGVQMQTRTMEWAAFLEKVRGHEFQAETAAWGTGTDPDTGRNLWMTDQYETGRNYGGYSNARVDELFIAGQKEFDFAKRQAIYQEIHKLIYDDQPYTWLFYRPTLQAVNNRVRGVSFSPRGLNNFNPGFLGWWSMK